MNGKRIIVSISALVLGAHAMAADPVQVKLNYVFESNTSPMGTQPVRVELQNNGPTARGLLRISSSGGQMDYPVELPQGSRKTIYTYPTVNYEPLIASLTTDKGTFNTTLPAQPGDGGATYNVLAITDRTGEFAFLGAQDKERRRFFADVYCSPDAAPDRTIAYGSFNAILLGEGAERMSSAQIDAIKSYLLTGGSIGFFGGAGSAVLSDPRWQEVVPVKDLKPVTISSSSYLDRIGGAPIPQATLLDGTPTSGAVSRSENGHLIVSERGYGLGRAFYLGVDLTDGPMLGWEGRRDALSAVIRPATQMRANQFMISGSGGNYVNLSSSPYDNTSDPFNFKLPPGDKILMILGAYFILVVPVNFLVLRKLRRSELAWVTAPVLSLGFAGALFSSAGNLYNAQSATASRGVLVGQEGQPNGVFSGSTEIFLPQAGFHDLHLENVDQLSNVSDYTGRGNVTSFEMNAVDTGEIKIDRMRTNSLSFQNLSYRQHVDMNGWYRVEKEGNGWRITNASPYALTGASLETPTRSIAVGNLAPGATVKAGIPQTEAKTKDAGPAPVISGSPSFMGATGTPLPVPVDPRIVTDFHKLLQRGSRVALTGRLADFRPGPKVGVQVEGRTSIDLLYFLEETAR